MKKSTKNLLIYVVIGVVVIIILIILLIIFRNDIWNCFSNWIDKRSDQDMKQWNDIIRQ